ncbi:GNAT family N-acetyltransferase [candidate division WOR-3 bacterium]|jgi:N-acetylglutamate synthase-like GNAT family acetyltransferase|nr:GNAT family N-acetyltransferase [candidate division WOR-3 bacterium]
MIKIRKIKQSDKERILQISSKIWEGGDYIPDVFDEWIERKDKIFVCIEDNHIVQGMANITIMPDGVLWFEGLRVDVDARRRGYGDMLNKYLIDEAKKRGRIIRLSTYFHNYESIHIIEKSGFKKIKCYLLVEKSVINTNVEYNELKHPAIDDIDFVPINWTFYENNRMNKKIISSSIHCLSDKDNSIFLAGDNFSRKNNTINIFKLIFKRRDNMMRLFNMAESFAVNNGFKNIATILPFSREVLDESLRYGFELWEKTKTNVFLYEKHL